MQVNAEFSVRFLVTDTLLSKFSFSNSNLKSAPHFSTNHGYVCKSAFGHVHVIVCIHSPNLQQQGHH